MWQSSRAHAHLDAGRHAGLAAVDARHAVLSQPIAPGAVGQNHGLGHDQVQRCAALAGADVDGLVALRFAATRVVELEVVVGAVEVFGLAAHHFALGFKRFGQLV